MCNRNKLLTRILLAATTLLAGFVTFTARAADYASTVGGFNPLGYWRFNETAASPALNTIANSGSLGSAANGVAILDVVKGQPGKVGNCIRLQNPGSTVGFSSSKVDVPYSTGLNPSSPFSIEFWLKPNALGGDTTGNCIINSLNANGFSGGNRSGYVVYLNNSGRIEFWLGLTSGYAGQLHTSSGTMTVGNWYHVVCTYDGATQRVYVNGASAGSLATSESGTGWKPNDKAVLRMGGTMLTGTLSPAATAPSVASTRYAGNRGLDGWLDEVAIYASVLSADQAKAHFDAATTNTAGYAAQILADAPRAYWQMEEAAVTAPDPSTLPIAANSGSVGSAADGTNMWGALAAQDGAPYAGFSAGNKAVFFDGANGSVDLPDAAGLHISGDITLMAWVKPRDRDYFRNIISQGLDDVRGENFLRVSRSDDANGGGTTTTYYEVGVANGVPAGFNLIFPGGTDNYYHAAVTPVPDGDYGNWVFLAGTYSSADQAWKIYRNGKLSGTTASAHGALNITNRWSIGSRCNPFPINAGVDQRFFPAQGLRFGGAIDEPAIINSALSATDIANLYNSALVPPVITRAVAVPPGVYKGSSGSFNVWAEGSPALVYVWYSNGVPTGVIATNITLNNLSAGTLTVDAVVSNPYGSATSSVSFLVVASKPLITQQPVAAARYVGRPFSFTVAAAGTAPISYQWQTNGVDITGATSATYNGVASVANAFNYSCILSNEAGTSNSVAVALTVVAAPTGYAGQIFADGPDAMWRLGETSGTTAYDYFNGHNGTYHSALLGQNGYSDLDSDKSVAFNGVNSYAGVNGDPASGGINYQGHRNFSLEAWVNGPAGMADESSIIAKGAGNSGTSATEQFSLDVATSTGSGEKVFRFFTRGGGDSLYQAFADIGPDGTWQHVVGVYDDNNSTGNGTNLLIYVNGELRGSGATRPSGLRASTVPVGIGSKRLGNNPNYDGTFNGNVDEAAAYGYALTGLQISNHYAQAYGTSTKPTIARQPASLTVYESSPTPARLEVGAFGTQPLSYQWKKVGVGDVIDDGVHVSGAQTRRLTIGDPNPVVPGDAGDYFCTINNTVGPATNTAVAHLSVIAAPTTNVYVPGLVLHMTFDGNLNDSSGHANHGSGKRATSVIGVSTNTTGASPGTPGGNPDFYYDDSVGNAVLGKSLHYHTQTDGGGNNAVTNAYYVSLGDRADLHFGTSANFSVAYWCRFPNFSGNGDLGDLPFFATAVNSYGNAGLTFAPSYQLGSWSYSLNGNVQLYGENYLLDDGNWHHIAHSFNRTGFAVTFIDGKQVDVRNMSTAGDLTTTNSASIGQDPTGFYPEEGYYDIDDLGVWRRALTSQEMVGIYLAAKLANSTFFDFNPTIIPGPGASQVTIRWDKGVLQSASSVTGPYTDVTGPPASPYTTASSPTTFYRVRLPQ